MNEFIEHGGNDFGDQPDPLFKEATLGFYPPGEHLKPATVAAVVTALGMLLNGGGGGPSPDRCVYEYPGDGTVVERCTNFDIPTAARREGPKSYNLDIRNGLNSRLQLLPDFVLDDLFKESSNNPNGDGHRW